MSRTKTKTAPIVDLDIRTVDAMLDRAASAMTAEDVALMKQIVGTLVRVTALVRERGTTLVRLRRLFGLSGSEKSNALFPNTTATTSDTSDTPPTPPTPATPAAATATPAETDSPSHAKPPGEKPKRKGHGRIATSAYAVDPVRVAHPTLRSRDRCPKCPKGTLYGTAPSSIVRIFGNAPLTAKAWSCEQLRCADCGFVHTAPPPTEARGPKYDDTAVATLALLRYGAGMPFNRLGELQRVMRIPVPKSTQWDVLEQRVESVRPAYQELRRLAAQGSVLSSDDTFVRILAFMGKRRARLLDAGKLPDPERTGLFTTAIVSDTVAGPIVMFSTGRHHAGENLAELLEHRDADLPPPIHMSDALSRNLPKGHVVIESNCIAHGRRQFVDERENHPAECRHLIEQIALVYKVDGACATGKLSHQERLAEHQRVSRPIMDGLHAWMKTQFEQKRVEPNSALGKAIDYFLKRWDKFTVFLREPGAPLDNNVTERALKKFIRQRRASLFFRSATGARVGDIFTSLIHTAELHGANPFDYLTELQRNARAVAACPADWMPWNYQSAIERLHPRAVA